MFHLISLQVEHCVPLWLSHQQLLRVQATPNAFRVGLKSQDSQKSKQKDGDESSSNSVLCFCLICESGTKEKEYSLPWLQSLAWQAFVFDVNAVQKLFHVLVLGGFALLLTIVALLPYWQYSPCRSTRLLPHIFLSGLYVTILLLISKCVSIYMTLIYYLYIISIISYSMSRFLFDLNCTIV